jgi:hypothetical protein
MNRTKRLTQKMKKVGCWVWISSMAIGLIAAVGQDTGFHTGMVAAVSMLPTVYGLAVFVTARTILRAIDREGISTV